MRFHLMHVIIPGGHGMMGYREVVESVRWGLTALGHEATIGINQVVPGARNIVFGAQALKPDELAALPPDTIVYNFEQGRGMRPEQLRPEMPYIAGRFRVWEYSQANLPTWAQMDMRFPAVHVPVGYAPNLERIEKPARYEIDSLIYGMPNELRLSAFNAVTRTGVSSVFLCGLYGRPRDQLISRSKTVLNVTLFNNMRIFEIVRVSFLLANRKAVVANIDDDTFIEEGVLDAIAATTPQTLAKTVWEICMNDDRRAELEQRGYDYFRTRDIRPILEAALEQS